MGHTYGMNHRLNSAIHLISACYWAFGTTLGTLFGPAPFRSSVGFRVWVIAGIGLIAGDLFAAAKQWRGSSHGQIFSIAVHFGVTTFIVALITFEFLQARPNSFLAWLKADNYWFIVALALVRVCAGATLLVHNKDRR